MKVVIIGSGNVATVLGRKILQAGDEIIQVVGRNVEKTAALASTLKTDYTTNLLEISALGDMYILAVSDSAISMVAAQLKLNDKMIVHTAAAVSKEALSPCSNNYGVLYPLQTFRKEITSIPVIPVLVDGNTTGTIESLISFASGWADTVSVASDEERLKVHVAAVFANNFTNHLFAVTEYFCNVNKFNFNMLKPLIEETVSRAGLHSPAKMQTGPAIRKDFETIEKHRKILENNLEALYLYKALSNSIIRFHDQKHI